jgi:hypothetical protein
MTKRQPTSQFPGTLTGELALTFSTIASQRESAIETFSAPPASSRRFVDVMKPLALVFGVVLAACTSPPPPPKIVPPQARLVPFELRRCPPGRPSPVAPPPPRTVQQLIDWTAQVHGALLFTERARTECASRLARLNDWIEAGK